MLCRQLQNNWLQLECKFSQILFSGFNQMPFIHFFFIHRLIHESLLSSYVVGQIIRPIFRVIWHSTVLINPIQKHRKMKKKKKKKNLRSPRLSSSSGTCTSRWIESREKSLCAWIYKKKYVSARFLEQEFFKVEFLHPTELKNVFQVICVESWLLASVKVWNHFLKRRPVCSNHSVQTRLERGLKV